MPQSHNGGGGNNKSFATQQSLNVAIKSICNIMRRSNCAGTLQYVPELTWILFLRILDKREMREAEEVEKVGKRNPLTLAHFEEFFHLLPEGGDSEHSWTVLRPEIDAKNYDLKAVNPHAKNDEDTCTPEELLNVIESKGREVAQVLEALRGVASPLNHMQ